MYIFSGNTENMIETFSIFEYIVEKKESGRRYGKEQVNKKDFPFRPRGTVLFLPRSTGFQLCVCVRVFGGFYER